MKHFSEYNGRVTRSMIVLRVMSRSAAVCMGRWCMSTLFLVFPDVSQMKDSFSWLFGNTAREWTANLSELHCRTSLMLLLWLQR